MMRVLPIALAAVTLASPAPAQEPFVETCTAYERCDVFGRCSETFFEFTFTYDDSGPTGVRHIVQVGRQAPVDAIPEPSTQGFTWGGEKHVYTMLYLYNAAYTGDDPPEFVVTEADAQGRVDAVWIYNGFCEVLN